MTAAPRFELRRAPREVVTPDECGELVRRHGIVALHPLMGGMPPELGRESLRLSVDRVLPRL